MIARTPPRRFLDKLGKSITAAVSNAKDVAHTGGQQVQQQGQGQGFGFSSWSSTTTSTVNPDGSWSSTTTTTQGGNPLANIWSMQQQGQQSQQQDQGQGGGFGGGGGGPFGGGGGGGGGDGGGGFGGGLFDQMLEWCSKAHAQDIARRQGIDLRDVHFSFDSAGNCTVHVDAPNATPAQIEALGAAVQEECPVARFRKTRMAGGESKKMEWVPLPPPS